MKKIGLLIVVVICVVIWQWDFGDDAVTPSNPQIEHQSNMIGISVDSMVIERWKKDVNILKSNAESKGYHVEVTNSFENASKQNEQIISLVDAGAKAIFIIPTDKDALSDSVAYAKKKGVVVIAYDRMIRNANVDAYVSFDNVAVGELMAGALIEAVPEGNYVIINGAPSDLNSYMFNEGYYNILAEHIESGAITLVDESWAEGWSEELAYNKIVELIENEVHIDGIIAANDLLAEGVISALAEHGLIGQISVVGHDAEVSACQRIVEGKQLMTVYKPIKNLAEGAIDVAIELMNEETIVSDDMIDDGTYEVPYIKFGVIPVFEHNMRETIIEDLFHLEEDVYRTE